MCTASDRGEDSATSNNHGGYQRGRGGSGLSLRCRAVSASAAEAACLCVAVQSVWVLRILSLGVTTLPRYVHRSCGSIVSMRYHAFSTGAVCGYGLSLCCYVISTGSDCRCGVVLSSWELAFHCSTVQSTQVVQRRDIRGLLSYCRLQILWARCLCAAYRIGQERSQAALCPRAGSSRRMARELAL